MGFSTTGATGTINGELGNQAEAVLAASKQLRPNNAHPNVDSTSGVRFSISGPGEADHRDATSTSNIYSVAVGPATGRKVETAICCG